ncbi:hypothetical protein BTN49_3194 [Candidatus Enterovibrio escicola]|uniref:Uncharacterized protein n=1 Tax=Candidatus Enterovibrio escicola TaxID=1927127 RepID=A0A2A5SZG3_9GAMM|nr:hypothetical protein BTN49_3194 [Candidatus Enterovibrio escacola]
MLIEVHHVHGVTRKQLLCDTAPRYFSTCSGKNIAHGSE